ncbi:MAG: heme oxygenase [Myxococcales bacterium]|nr:heme oxygenase [Myxococcales bacterium]|tara:strand:- start:474 stop:1274 length:801 start_codon:yes stop_codon:yes gene_type:complete
MRCTEQTIVNEDRLTALLEAVGPHRIKILEHPVYERLNTLDDVRAFMGSHVFAVWDFMCLLKALQRKLTCVDVPWIPVGDKETRRLINEIVLAEESDEMTPGSFQSHYEMYRTAMETCGASSEAIDTLMDALRRGASMEESLLCSAIPDHVRAFSGATARVIQGEKIHAIAGAFTIGRESTIPSMFRELVRRLRGRHPKELSVLVDYLDRHIELDDEHHGPMAMKMLSNLCGDSDEKWKEATAAAIDALTARHILWDGVCKNLKAH